MPYELVIRRDGEELTRRRFARGVTTIGRSRSNTMVLDSGRVSRHHVALTIDSDGDIELQDLGSRNGTMIDGTPVRRTLLRSGERFHIGGFAIELIRVDDGDSGSGVSANADIDTTLDDDDESDSIDRQEQRFFIGRSPQASELLQLVERVGPTSMSVLIRGESGVGKGVVARLIHEWGDSSRPFVDVDCAAIPHELVESELFGHERGAFTGADRDRIGKFQAADGGTLFLDEIGDMSTDAQAKILRAIEDGRIEPVGARQPVTVSVRVVAATNRDLEAAMRVGGFREDLYYRLANFTIDVPPLRERRDDIILLASFFLAELSDQIPAAAGSYLSPEAVTALSQHDWPGNIRELRNVLAQALVRKEGTAVEPDHLSLRSADSVTDSAATIAAKSAPQLSPLERAQTEQIARALQRNGGNISRSAAELGIARNTLKRRMSQLGLEQPPRKAE